MTKSSSTAAELHPRQIVRKADGPKYFGLKRSQLEAAIKNRLVPQPFALTEGGRARGWLGQQIIEHQRRLMAACEQADDDGAA
jgi:predicted DNA-binding transcriptional regulator AlpA